MKTAVLSAPRSRQAEAVLARRERPCSRRYLALTKPRIAVMVLVTVATGFLLGARAARDPSDAAPDACSARGWSPAAASAWNQYPRAGARPADAADGEPALARRAARAGRGRGVRHGARRSLGVAILALWVNASAAAWRWRRSCSTWPSTRPLKPMTTLNTAIGAVPGALPPVIGWAAATGRLGVEAWALFLIVFLWQFPHFLAIAWIYRDDYARGGHRMLPTVDPRGAMTGRQAAGYALALVPAGLLPTVVGLAGRLYFAGRPGLGLVLPVLRRPVLVARSPTRRPAASCGPRSCTCPRS